MSLTSRPPTLPRIGIYFGLLIVLLACLCVAGGASRPDVPGQVVVRGMAWLTLIVAILAAPRPGWRDAGPAMAFFVAILACVLIQLVPVPPAIWSAFPGRELLVQAATVSGQPQPWRPLSIVPEATRNAAASLVVPFAVLLFTANLADSDRRRLPTVFLAVIFVLTLIGLIQFTGAGFNNPLVNEDLGDVSGTFANRNHFALLLAIGCVLAPVWAFHDEHRARWRAPMALGTVLLFVLTILASGSRAGILVGGIALVLGLVLSRQGIRRALRHAPRWALPSLITAILGMIAILVLVSVAADRAVSINRALEVEVGADIRHRSLPVVLDMTKSYFPAGSGYGSFDPTFRIHEPFDLLKLTFFNHAHDDFLEIVMTGGLPGLLLLVIALGWWVFTSVRAWRAKPGSTTILPKLGSAILLLVFVASLFDYPARTPIIMAVVAIAAIWLGNPRFTSDRAVSIGHGDPHLSGKDMRAHA